MSQQDNKCPFQDICATIRYHKLKRKDYIHEVCDTKEHQKCTHFMGLYVNPEWVTEARRRLDELCRRLNHGQL